MGITFIVTLYLNFLCNCFCLFGFFFFVFWGFFFFFLVCIVFFFFIAHSSNDFEVLNRYIWHIDCTLTRTISLGESGLGNNGIKLVLHSPDLQNRNHTRYQVVFDSRSAYVVTEPGKGCSRHPAPGDSRNILHLKWPRKSN